MPRPSVGELPPSTSPSPYHTPPGGMSLAPGAVPLNYAGQPVPPAPVKGSAPTPAGLFNAFRRRWVLGTMVGTLAASVVIVGLWFAMPGGKHEARGLVDLRKRDTDLALKGGDDYESYRKNQAFILRTRDLITRTVGDPSVSSLAMIKTAEDPVLMLEDNLTVTNAAPEILAVTLKGNDLPEMKTVVNTLMKKYVDDATASARRDRVEQQKKLEALLENLKAEADSLERQIKLIAQGTGITGPTDANTANALLLRRLSELEGIISSENDKLTRLEASRKVAKLQVDSGAPTLAPELLQRAVEARPEVITLTARLKEFNRLLADAEKNATPPVDKSPAVVELRTQVKKVEEELEKTKKQVVGEVEETVRLSTLTQLQARIATFDEQIAVAKEIRDRSKADHDTLKKTLQGAAGAGIDVAALLQGLVPQREAIAKIQNQLVQLRIGRELDNREKVREEAQGLTNSNLNKKLALCGFGGLGTFGMVVLLVAFLEWRTRRVDGADQVVTELGMRIIGTVPAFPNRASLKAAAEAGGANWRFVLNESINSTRTMLLHAARSQSMQVVMVTSATQGEGKTSLSSQLATSMATAGMRTLIVDCDLRNPSIHKLFDLSLTSGVCEILTQDVDAADATQPTAVPNLWVIPAGQCSNRVIAALAQGHPLETLFNRLRGQFDFIMVDSCPVLPVADALLIGQHVDGVVFSIMQDISQLPKVLIASEKLAQLNIPLVGAVVNGIKQDVYSYGYNYVKQLPA